MPEWFDSEPLGWAASFGHLDVVRKLVELGADPRRPANKAGNTPLCDARRERHVHVATFLEEYERRFRTQTMSRDERDKYELAERSLAAEDLAGCWGCVAWPFFGACEYRRAEGKDVLRHEGICFPCLVPYREAWDRVGFTNTFRKRNSKDTIPYDPRNPGFFCFGSGCTWRWCK